MSTKLEDNNKNDWDVDDDNDWDDWGDAEDNMEDEKSVPTSKQHANMDSINKTVKPENNNINDDNITTKMVNNNVSSETQNPTITTPPSQTKSSGWGSLFGGVVSTVFSTATELSTTVSHGLDKVIGVPNPEEMARINAIEEAKVKSQQQRQQPQTHTEDVEDERALTPSNAAPVFGLGLVNNVTSLGSKVLNTGLDTLEGIGKKTMNILQENDPLIKNKIKKLGLEQDKPNLSEVSNILNCFITPGYSHFREKSSYIVEIS